VPAKPRGFAYRLPVLQGVLPISGRQLPREAIAALTLAALAIPEAMGYTKIAGMPVITGLYTIVIPMVLFAIFGSSRHLVVGADSATAAILAAGLAGIAASGSTEYVALAGMLALMAAGLLLIARLIRLGFLSDFLSRTVLTGFLTGVGIQVAVSQLPGMLGLADVSHLPFMQLLNIGRQFDRINPSVLGLSLAVITVTVGARTVSKSIPGPLIAVICAITASWALDLRSHGVQVLGAIPSGLPRPTLPGIAWSLQLFQRLLPSAFSMFVVILAQSAATSRAYAARYNEPHSENRDLIGLCLANLGAGLSGSFVVNGSPTKTQVVDSAGGRSQVAQILTAAIALIVLLYLTTPLSYLPQAVLSTVVFLIGLELIDASGMRRILVERPWEFWVALITTLVVAAWGVEQGIILAAVLSLLVHTRHGYRPTNVVLVNSGKGYVSTLPVSSMAQIVPGLVVYRFTHSIYYANSQLLSEQVLQLIDGAPVLPRWFCIDAGAVDDLDFTAAETLRSIVAILRQRGIRLVFAVVSDNVRKEMDRSGLTGLLGADAYYGAVGDVVNAYRETQPSTAGSDTLRE
jgi:high affinity sulfate transporter 1